MNLSKIPKYSRCNEYRYPEQCSKAADVLQEEHEL